MDKFLKNLESKYPNQTVYTIPIKDITKEFPILEKFWNEYKGMINYGTKPIIQTKILNTIIDENKYLKQMQIETLKYPNKKKYDILEEKRIYLDNNKSIQFPKITYEFNNVWCVKDGKYQHLINNMSFPKYYWRKDELDILKDLKLEPRGNFYYPKKSFREWHTNRFHIPGWRIYFISCKEDNKSFFNYIDPKTDKLHHVPDRNEYANIFKVSNKPEKVVWHSIFSNTDRFSLGFNLYDS